VCVCVRVRVRVRVHLCHMRHVIYVHQAIIVGL